MTASISQETELIEPPHVCSLEHCMLSDNEANLIPRNVPNQNVAQASTPSGPNIKWRPNLL